MDCYAHSVKVLKRLPKMRSEEAWLTENILAFENKAFLCESFWAKARYHIVIYQRLLLGRV